MKMIKENLEIFHYNVTITPTKKLRRKTKLKKWCQKNLHSEIDFIKEKEVGKLQFEYKVFNWKNW